MKFRFPVLFAFIVFGSIAAVFGQSNSDATAAGLALAKTLPTSDAVAVLDTKRLFADALPQILSDSPKMLGEILGHADEIKKLTGIDIRQFDRVAVGATIKTTGPKNVDLSPVVLAQGKYTPESLLAGVKLASGGDYHEASAGGKTIYVFTQKDGQALTDNLPKVSNSWIAGMIDRVVKGITSQEIAVGAVNADTIAFGPLPRVKAMLESGPRVTIVPALTPGLQHGGVASFGATLPAGMSAILGYDNDELGKSINTIRYLSGWLDQGDGSTVVRVTAKTTKPQQAEDLKLMLEDLQAIGKALIGGSKGADKQVYARMIGNAKFTRTANELNLDLQIPQADINILIGEKK